MHDKKINYSSEEAVREIGKMLLIYKDWPHYKESQPVPIVAI